LRYRKRAERRTTALAETSGHACNNVAEWTAPATGSGGQPRWQPGVAPIGGAPFSVRAYGGHTGIGAQTTAALAAPDVPWALAASGQGGGRQAGVEPAGVSHGIGGQGSVTPVGTFGPPALWTHGPGPQRQVVPVTPMHGIGGQRNVTPVGTVELPTAWAHGIGRHLSVEPVGPVPP
jgi:hypothetical protein